jgi:alcohol dehydrogenase (cytochrome c)
MTGEQRWEFVAKNAIFTGLLSTASNLIFAAASDGTFYALDARTGRELWSRWLGGDINAAPMTYSAGGRQYLAVAAGNALFAFALRQ